MDKNSWGETTKSQSLEVAFPATTIKGILSLYFGVALGSRRACLVPTNAAGGNVALLIDLAKKNEEMRQEKKKERKNKKKLPIISKTDFSKENKVLNWKFS